jgi:hypothetical protein
VVTLADYAEILHVEAVIDKPAYCGVGSVVIIEDGNYDVTGSHVCVSFIEWKSGGSAWRKSAQGAPGPPRMSVRWRTGSVPVAPGVPSPFHR